jgi:hypothetical protein
MIVRQVSPWSLGWNAPRATFAQTRRDMESLMERLTGAAPEGSLGGVSANECLGRSRSL